MLKQLFKTLTVVTVTVGAWVYSGAASAAEPEKYVIFAKETLVHVQGEARHALTSLTGMEYRIVRADDKTSYVLRLSDAAVALDDLALYAQFDPTEIRPIVVEKTSAGVTLVTKDAERESVAFIQTLIERAEKIAAERTSDVARRWQDVVQDKTFGAIPAEFRLSPIDMMAGAGELLLIEYRAALPGRIVLSGHLVIDKAYHKPLLAITRQHRQHGDETFTLVREMVLQDEALKPIVNPRQVVATQFPVDAVFTSIDASTLTSVMLPNTAQWLAVALDTDAKILASAERGINPVPIAGIMTAIAIDGAIEATFNVVGGIGSAMMKNSEAGFVKFAFNEMAEYKGGVSRLGYAVGGETGEAIASTASMLVGGGAAIKGAGKLFAGGGNAVMTQVLTNSGRVGAFVPEARLAYAATSRAPVGSAMFSSVASSPFTNAMAGVATKFGRRGERLADVIRRTDIGENGYGLYEAYGKWAQVLSNKEVAQAVSQSAAASMAANGLSPAGSASGLFVGGYFHPSEDVRLFAETAQSAQWELAQMRMTVALWQQMQMQQLFEFQNQLSRAVSAEKASEALDEMVYSELFWDRTLMSGYQHMWMPRDHEYSFGDPALTSGPMVPAGATAYITEGAVTTTYTARPGTFNAPVTAVYAFNAPHVSYTQGTTRGAYAELSINGGPASVMPATTPVRIPWLNEPEVLGEDWYYLTDWITAKDTVSLRDGGTVQVKVVAPENGAVVVIERH